MARVVECEQCKTRFRSRNGREGQEIQCPKCQAVFPFSSARVAVYEVFVSHAKEDKSEADALCKALEEKLVGCWIAPRDIPLGAKWDEAIVEGVNRCRALVLVFSSRANESSYVAREVRLAGRRELPIVPVWLESVPPCDALDLFVNTHQGMTTSRADLNEDLEGFASEVATMLREMPVPAGPASVPAPGGPGSTYTKAWVLEQDTEDFEAGALSHVADELDRKRLVCARQAIQEVARMFDGRWERGRHTLSEEDVIPLIIPPNDRLTVSLALRIRNVLVEHLKNAPHGPFNIESDEGGTLGSDPRAKSTWIIDAIDGSRHLMRHLPLFTTTVALVDERRRAALAIVYAPVTGELFFAARGCGAYLNNWDTPLDVSTRTAEDAYVYVEFPNRDSLKRARCGFNRQCRSLKRILKTVYRVRGCGLGSLGMAYTAKGAFDAYISLSGKTRECDVLAGSLLVTEAGGKARTVPSGVVDESVPRSLGHVYAAAGNPAVFDHLMADRWLKRLFKE